MNTPSPAGTPAGHGHGRRRRYRDFNDALSRNHGHDAMAYIIELLSDLDHGEHVNIDFLGRKDVGRFCRALGITRNWAELTIAEIAPSGARGPHEVPQEEADLLLTALTRLIEADVLVPKDGSSFDPTTLNDFLPEGGFHGKPTRGNTWEFAFALAVELEHGRTFGTNVTNNHPALTALIVMAHVLEDRLYYARLWVMEVEGELLKLTENGAPADDIVKIEEELRQAKDYLATRIAQP